MNLKVSAALEKGNSPALTARRQVVYEVLSGGTGLLLAYNDDSNGKS